MITLSALQSARISCTAGTLIQLAGNGASYLIVPQFATGGVAKTPVSYTLGPPATHASIVGSAARMLCSLIKSTWEWRSRTQL